MRNSSPRPRMRVLTRCSPPRRGVRRLHAAGLVGLVDATGAAGYVGDPAVRAHTNGLCDGRADTGPSVRWPAHSRARRVRSAGGRGLVRAAVSQAAGSHPRIHRHRAPGVGPRIAGDQRRAALPAATDGEGTTGLGKALKPITHPLRADIPIMLGAEGPKNVALAAEICDGWLPIFYSPRMAGMYNEWLDEGFARPGAQRSREDFRDLRDGAGGHHRRSGGRVCRNQAVPGALHGQDGRRRDQLPRRRLSPDGVHASGR